MFGQVVIGPPGSGKSTYCHGMYQFMLAVGRKCGVVNLDPANDRLPYPCVFDIRSMLTVEEVMDEYQLGPNGGLMYALESLFLEEKDQDGRLGLDVVVEQIVHASDNGTTYLVFDCPGQVELFTHAQMFPRLFQRLAGKQYDFRLCVVLLMDLYYLTLPLQYVLVLLLALRLMLLMDLPVVNVLLKIDLIHQYGELPFLLDFYTECLDLQQLVPYVEAENKTNTTYTRLTEAIAEMVEEYGLVLFEVLAVEDKQSMVRVLLVVDKANGYLYGTTEAGGDAMWVEAVRQLGPVAMEVDIQERWIDHKADYDRAAVEEQEARRAKAEFLDQPLDDEAEVDAAMAEWDRTHART